MIANTGKIEKDKKQDKTKHEKNTFLNVQKILFRNFSLYWLFLYISGRELYYSVYVYAKQFRDFISYM